LHAKIAGVNTEPTLGLTIPPRLFPGERVLYFQPWLRAVTSKSLPSYRIAPGIPVLEEMALYVTDRRLLLAAWLMRLVRFEWSAWFGNQDESADRDWIREVSVGRSSLLGRYVQLVTYDPVKHWYRSLQAQVRFFVKDPDSLYRLLSERLGAPAPGA
jgi:hypothetical protein